MPSVLLPTWNQGHTHVRPQRVDSKSLVSASTGGSAPLQTFCAELKEMALLVDVDSHLQDVTEAHLRFERNEQPKDLPAALQSTMPNLRKLVKPSEFEKVRSKAVKFTETQHSNAQHPLMRCFFLGFVPGSGSKQSVISSLPTLLSQLLRC